MNSKTDDIELWALQNRKTKEWFCCIGIPELWTSKEEIQRFKNKGLLTFKHYDIVEVVLQQRFR